MFKRRDIPPVLLLLVLLVLVMLTLSQILVVHNGRYGRNVQSMRRLQLELRELDLNLHSLMMQNVPSIELNRRMLVNQINTNRFASILKQAAESDTRFTPNRTLRRQLELDMEATLVEAEEDEEESEPLLISSSSSSSSSSHSSFPDVDLHRKNSSSNNTYCPSVPPGLSK